jgi:hypothetical protein
VSEHGAAAQTLHTLAPPGDPSGWTRSPASPPEGRTTPSWRLHVEETEAQAAALRSAASPLHWTPGPAPAHAVEMPTHVREAAWSTICSEFPRPVDGTCRVMAGGAISIRLKPGAQPKSVHSCRPVPVNLRVACEKEIREQQAAGIIEPADDMNDPAAWLNPTVLVRKKDPSQVRITVDLRELNLATFRPPFLSPTPWQVVTQVSPQAAVFTVLDGLKGFHQLELDEPSRKLTTFATILGRFRYRRLPMGGTAHPTSSMSGWRPSSRTSRTSTGWSRTC